MNLTKERLESALSDIVNMPAEMGQEALKRAAVFFNTHQATLKAVLQTLIAAKTAPESLEGVEAAIERMNASIEKRLVKPFLAVNNSRCQICCRCGKPMSTIGNQFTCDKCHGLEYILKPTPPEIKE